MMSFTNLPEALPLIFGNGSSDLLNILFQTFCLPSGRVLTVEPDFFLYKRLSYLYGCHALEKIEYLVSNTDSIVVIDEAYFPYADVSCVSLLNQYDNLIVIQSLSKLGLAGIRLGYLMSQQRLLEAIKKVILPFNVSAMSLHLAQCLLNDAADVSLRIKKTIDERRRICDWIKQSNDYTVHASHTNFINMKPLFKSSKALHAYLLSQKIKTTYVDVPGFIDDMLRVSISTPSHNDEFLTCLSKFK
jgi:histidinol-phosphate aminotransferase